MLDYSIRYFMSHIDRIGTPDYLPSVEDVLHVKTKTLGIVEIDFFIKSIHVKKQKIVFSSSSCFFSFVLFFFFFFFFFFFLICPVLPGAYG